MLGLLEVGGGGANFGGRQSVLTRQNISNRIYPTTPFSALMMMTMTMAMMTEREVDTLFVKLGSVNSSTSRG